MRRCCRPAPLASTFSRELLALSSILSIARTGGLLSPMNAEIITREAHTLLQEIAAYEEPRLLLDEMPTLSGIAKNVLEAGYPPESGHRDAADLCIDAEKPPYSIKDI